MRTLIYHRLNIGDLVLASPALQAFVRAHPEADVRVVTNDLAGRIAAWLPGVKGVDTYGRYGPGEAEWRVLLRMRRWKPELAIALSPSPDPKIALRFLVLVNGVGFATGEALYRMAYARRLQVPHEAMHVAELLALLFGIEDLSRLPAVRLECGRMAHCDYDVWIHAGARKPSNRPSAVQLFEIVRGIRDAAPGARVAITTVPEARPNPAHPSDAAVMAELQARFRGEHGIDLLSPDLSEAVEVIRRSRSAITPDGGLMHIAAAVGIPVVGMMGDIGVQHWRPFSPNSRWLQAPSRFVSEIRADEVLRAWRELTHR